MMTSDAEELKQILLRGIVKQDGPLDTQCWIWTGPHDHSNGYGRIQLNKVRWTTNRLSYSVFVGPIPDGLQVNHHCDVFLCCRPEHLYLGTQQDNIDDVYKRGRGPYRFGEANGAAVLTDAQASEILFLALEGRLTQEQIASLYGRISRVVVSNIKTRKIWPHITPKAPTKIPQLSMFFPSNLKRRI
jgi:hypothetical protein